MFSLITFGFQHIEIAQHGLAKRTPFEQRNAIKGQADLDNLFNQELSQLQATNPLASEGWTPCPTFEAKTFTVGPGPGMGRSGTWCPLVFKNIHQVFAVNQSWMRWNAFFFPNEVPQSWVMIKADRLRLLPCIPDGFHHSASSSRNKTSKVVDYQTPWSRYHRNQI